MLRRLWAQLSAVGVGRIVLVNAEKVERQYFDNTWLHENIYRQELIHGLEQSGETYLPQVIIRKKLKPFIEDELNEMFEGHSRFIADPSEERTDFRLLKVKDKIVIAVGHEGGWTDFEREMFNRVGFKLVSMGRRILRSDTACVVLTGLFNYLYGKNNSAE